MTLDEARRDEDAKEQVSKRLGQRIRKLGRSAGKFLLLALFTLGGLGAFYEVASGFVDSRRFPAPGVLHDVGGYRLHLNCLGEGSPTVLLESGLGRDSMDWSWVQPGLAEKTKVCSYDRAGAGWSDPGPLPRDSRSVARELHLLLEAADINEPLVLVGHSAGGSHLRLFAQANPDNVAALALVDVSHLKSPKPPPELLVGVARVLHFFGVLRIFGLLDGSDLPPEAQPAANAVAYRRSFLSTLVAENVDAAESLRQVQQITHDGVLGDLPLLILTAAGPIDEEKLPSRITIEEAREERRLRHEKQSEMLGMSSNSLQIFADKSGHQIHKDQPELLVTSVLDLVSRSRPVPELR